MHIPGSLLEVITPIQVIHGRDTCRLTVASRSHKLRCAIEKKHRHVDYNRYFRPTDTKRMPFLCNYFLLFWRTIGQIVVKIDFSYMQRLLHLLDV